jgi:hypothetical protein
LRPQAGEEHETIKNPGGEAIRGFAFPKKREKNYFFLAAFLAGFLAAFLAGFFAAFLAAAIFSLLEIWLLVPHNAGKTDLKRSSTKKYILVLHS